MKVLLAKRKTHEQYCKEVAAIHGEKIIPLENYIKNNIKILHKCNTCKHEWKVIPASIVNEKSTCPKCSHKALGKTQTKSHEQYCKEIQKIHKGTIIPIENYRNANTAILHRCIKCGREWKLIPTNVISSSRGCTVCNNTGSSKVSIQWLNHLASKFRIKIQHYGAGGEYVIHKPESRGHWRLDGFNRTKNLAFEFYGDCFHGNPKIYKPKEKCHPREKTTAAELYSKTIERETALLRLGYALFIVWESDYHKGVLGKLVISKHTKNKGSIESWAKKNSLKIEHRVVK